MEKNDIPQLLSRARAFRQSGNLKEAEALCQLILISDAQHADALGLLGAVYLQRGNPSEGVKLLQSSLNIKPRQPAILKSLCKALEKLKRYDEAAAQYKELMVLMPKDAEACYGYGNAMRALKRYDEALASYAKAVAIKPDISISISQGNVLYAMKRYDEALASYDKAIAIKPDYAGGYINRGLALLALGYADKALAASDKAITLAPKHAEAHINRATILRALGRHGEALASCDKAIALAPKHAEAHNRRGSILREIRRYKESIISYDKALALNPSAEIYNNKGNALRDLKRYSEAVPCYEKALSLKPDIPYLRGNSLAARMHIDQWQDIDAAFAELAEEIKAGKSAVTPFSLLPTPLSPALQKQCAEIYFKGKFPGRKDALWNGEKYAHDRIRLGYFSSDFHNHATAYLMAELFELHDRTKFEVNAFSFGTPNDAMRGRLEKAFDRFIDVRAKPDSEIAALAREMEIDIALDLKGFTQHAKTGIFTLRPAPVQVNYLVFPGTMGTEHLDYLIADPILIPESHRQFYSEKIVYMPHSYQVNDSSKKISDRQFTRSELGLPEKGFVFCCFNNNYKITPDVFDIWMRLLHKVEGSVLWLLEGNPAARQNLCAEAAARGIGEERLVFAGRMELSEHLARHCLADLFLDTFYCNAHTTASDALWGGLPVITCLGETFAARVAASLLHAIGLPELVTQSHEAYEALALELATQPEKLSAIKARLAKNRKVEPLFNTRLYTRHIEAAYVQMWERYQAGLPPDHFHIKA